MTVQNAPYIEVDPNNSTAFGVMQSAGQNYVNSLNRLGSVFGDIKNQLQDNWYTSALQKSMGYDDPEAYGQALADGTIDMHGLTAEQSLALANRKKDIASTKLSILEGKEAEIRFKQQEADDKFFSEHPEIASTVAELQAEAARTGDMSKLIQYVNELSKTGASHRVLKAVGLDPYQVQKDLASLQLEKEKVSIARASAGLQAQLAQRQLTQYAAEDGAAIIASNMSQMGVTQDGSDAGTVLNAALDQYTQDPNLKALIKANLAAKYGLNADTAKIANLTTTGQGIEDRADIQQELANRYGGQVTYNPKNPLENAVIEGIAKDSNGNYKVNDTTFSTNVGNQLITKANQFKDKLDKLNEYAILTGNIDFMRDEDTKQAAIALGNSGGSPGSFEKYLKQVFPSAPSDSITELSNKLSMAYSSQNRVKNPVYFVSGAMQLLSNDVVPFWNVLSVNMGKGVKLNTRNVIGQDNLVDAAINAERLYGNLSRDLGKAKPFVDTAQVYLTDASSRISDFHPNSRASANNPNARADISASILKLENAITSVDSVINDFENKNAIILGTAIKNSESNK